MISGRHSAGHTSAARDGIVESIRVLRNARASAVTARTQAMIHLKNLVVTGPELRESHTGLTSRQLVQRYARMHRPRCLECLGATRPRCGLSPAATARFTPKCKELQAELTQLVAHAAPRLLRAAPEGVRFSV